MTGTLTLTVLDPASGKTGTLTTPLPPITPRASGLTFGVEAVGNDIRWPGGTPAAIARSYSVTKAALARDLGSRGKFFDSSKGIAYAVTMRQATGALEPWPLYALQAWDTASTKSFLDGLNHQCRICLKQEFTADIAGGEYTATTYNGWTAAFCAQLDAHPNGHLVRFAFVGAEAAERSAPTPIWPSIVVPHRADGTPTEVGNDTYVSISQMLNPAKAFKASVDWITALKAAGRTDIIPSVSECGVSRTQAGFTPAARIQFLNDTAAYLPTIDLRFAVSYWAGNNAGGTQPSHDWSFDQPGDEPVAAKVASLISV